MSEILAVSKAQPKPSVLTGREARLNRAIFRILAEKAPLILYDIYKHVRKMEGLHRTRYNVLRRRIRRLEEQGYVRKIGARKTQPGPRRPLYDLTDKAHTVMLGGGRRI